MTKKIFSLLAVAVTIGACTGGSDKPANVPAAATTADSSSGDVALPAASLRFTVAATGSAARYRVREQLMGKDLPNDAIGETQQVSGGIVIDSTTGAVVSAQSKFVVNVATLKSDSDRRDGYVGRRILETDKFPTVELVPTALKGLTAAAAAAAKTTPGSFELIGDLTVKGVTHPTTWRVSAQQDKGTVTGKASTRFVFADFGLTPPKVPVVLSVADTIGLEIDFTLTRTP